jgi:hypothetical protein
MMASPIEGCVVDWRITYFVNSAERTPEGWLVHGERGLGPPTNGDVFSFVHHQDSGQDDEVVLRIKKYDESFVLLAATEQVELRAGDILGGEVES